MPACDGEPTTAGPAAGLAMLDVLMAIAVLTVGILGTAMSTVRSSELRQATRDYKEAHNIARDTLEQLRDGDLRARFAAFAATPDFTVRAHQVSVRFPEALLLPVYGGSVPTTARFRDLDTDGEVELDNTSAAAGSLLPVRITVRRNSLRFELESLITDR